MAAEKAGANPSGTGAVQAQSSAGSMLDSGFFPHPVWPRLQSQQHLMEEDGHGAHQRVRTAVFCSL